MPRFDAGALVERLDYTFQPFHKDEGTVPEPSDKQVGEFLQGLKDLLEQAAALSDLAPEAGEAPDPAAMLDALNQLSGDEYVKIMGSMCDMFGALCSDKPSGQTLREVPVRPRKVFFEWVQEEVLNPEAKPAAGTAGPNSQA